MKDLDKWSGRRLVATFRIAKTRLYPFFRFPRTMIALRNECERRGLVVQGRIVAQDGQKPAGLAT